MSTHKSPSTTRILGLKGIVVMRVSLDEHEIHYLTRRDLRLKPQCSHCQSRAVDVRRRERRIVRDLDQHDQRVTLNVEVWQLYCRACERYGIWGYPWLEPRARHTRRFQDRVFRLAQHLSLKHTAELMELGEDRVRDLDLAECRARFTTPNLDGVHALAVDEKAIRKGHEYMTVVLGLDEQGKTRRILDCAAPCRRSRDRVVAWC